MRVVVLGVRATLARVRASNGIELALRSRVPHRRLAARFSRVLGVRVAGGYRLQDFRKAMAGNNGGNIVAEWLRSLHLGQYAESFIDNGYDDLEICKQVGDPDLDAIGVFNPTHRARLLQSVRTLREEGAASVYFSLEESVAVHEECLCDNVSARSSRTSSGRCSEKEQCGGIGAPAASPAASSSADSGPELAKYVDEYEEGKAELVKIPRMQLKILLRDKLAHDGIKLTCQPYTTPVSLFYHHRPSPSVVSTVSGA